MFENVKPPEDIFAGVDSGAVPPPPIPQDRPEDTRRAEAVPAMPPAESLSAPRAVSWKPIIVVITVLVVVGSAGAIAYLMMASKGSAVPAEPAADLTVPAVMAPVTKTPPAAVTTPKQDLPADTIVPPTTETDPVVAPAPAVDTTDRDKDGLTDAEEAKLGTSPTSADTDADGLFDKEEVMTYKTNPLNPDTDGDTYLDGAEVKGGYNPNGPGKLFGSVTP